MIVVEPIGSPTDHHTRPGVGKSLLGATGGWGCERERFYGETVREPDTGYRLRWGANPEMVFGTAVDVLVAHLLRQRVTADRAGAPLELDLQAAITAAFSRCRGERLDRPWTDEEWDTLLAQLTQAGEKFAGTRPNHPEGKDSHPGPPVLWLPVDGMMTQGRDGATLAARFPTLDRPAVGTPDVVYQAGGVFTAWVDVKASGRAYSYPAKWVGAEAVLYDYLLAYLNGGQPPVIHGYLEYRRNAKPYWNLTMAEVVFSASQTLLLALDRRWAKALREDDVDGLGWDTSKCGDCPWREPMVGYGHPGCPVGQAVVEVAPPPPKEK